MKTEEMKFRRKKIQTNKTSSRTVQPSAVFTHQIYIVIALKVFLL